MSASELPKPVKVVFKTKDTSTKESALLLKRFNQLNPRVETGEVAVYHKMTEPHSIRWIFEVNQVAAEAIKQADFGSYMSLNREIFKIFIDPNKPKEIVTEIKPTSF